MNKMKTQLRSTALLLCAVMFFGFTGCDMPVSESSDTGYDTPASKPVEFTVKFETNGGSDVAQITIEEGKLIVKPDNPSKATTAEASYTFDGWYLDKEFTTAFNFEGPITSDITLYAKWAVTSLYKTIISSLTNGTITVDKSSGIKAGETVILTVTPASGYKLSSLTVKNGDKIITVKNNTFTMPEGSVTISAKFTAEVQKPTTTPEVTPVIQPEPEPEPTPVPDPANYTVTFNSDGGSEVTSQIVTEGTAATEPSAPSKNGYTFGGWFNGNTEFNFSTAINENLTLTAKWNIISYTITYSGIDGATNPNTATTYTIESEDINLLNASKDGFTFNEWKNGTTAVTKIEKGSTGNITLTATWTNVNGITATIAPASTIGITSSNYDKLIILTPETGFSNYTWYFDGALVAEGTSPVMTVDSENQLIIINTTKVDNLITPGVPYQVSLHAVKDGILYSTQLTITR